MRWLDFPRPRAELIEENRSCPVLVLRGAAESSLAKRSLQQAKSRWFVEGADGIAAYLARVHGIGIPH